MIVATRMQFNVCKTSGKLRPGQVVECSAGAALADAGHVPGLMLTGVPGPLKYYARMLPVPRVYADNTARALSVLGHPNVVGPIGVGGDDGETFIVQEMPEGEALERWIQRVRATGVRLTLREVEQIFRQAVTALRHAHQAQIRHGSLGSSQVRVARQSSGELHVQVVDFGIFPLIAAHAPSVSMHEWHQLSPEQASQPANATVASDLFALGVLLMELLTGHAFVPPGEKMPWRELCVARPHEVRATALRERPDTPDGVLDLLAGLLRARPEDRTPATAMDLARALPRLSWEPRAELPVPDAASRATPRPSDPGASSPERPSTMAPSRNFVVSGASFSRSVAPTGAPAANIRPPAATPRAPPPPVASDPDDATLNEETPQALLDAIEGAMSPRSWFASDSTVVTTGTSDLDETMLEPDDATTGDQGFAQSHPDRSVPHHPGGGDGFFRPEGTMVLAHPDQLAAPRGDAHTWDGTRAVEAPPPGHAPPHTDATVPINPLRHVGDDTVPVTPIAPEVPAALAPVPFGLPTVESTMPDTVMPDALRAALPFMGMPPRPSEPKKRTLPPPARPKPPSEGSAHPALIAVVVTAAGAVLGLILWGLLHS